jgi:hypothetical protein
MQMIEPERRSSRRPIRSIYGRMAPVVTRKMTYWMADE